MSNVEQGGTFETKEIVENVRTQIDGRHHLVVTTRKVGHPAYAGKGIMPEITDVVIEDVDTGKESVDFGRLIGLSEQEAVSFIPSEEFAANPEMRSVFIDCEELEDPREIFAILHELGHIRVCDVRGEDYLNDVMMNRVNILITRTVPDIGFKIQDERDSWAEAIKLARRIKREFGVNLFNLFSNVDEFMGWLRATGLRTYESELESWGDKAYTKDKKVKLWQDAEKQKGGLLAEEVKAEDFNNN